MAATYPEPVRRSELLATFREFYLTPVAGLGLLESYALLGILEDEDQGAFTCGCSFVSPRRLRDSALTLDAIVGF